jgi:predicted AlkP superfamily pyrophosphatase or phosphodiesterase
MRLLWLPILMLFARPARAAPVVLISVDGMLPAYYLEPDKYGLQIPTIRALVKEGAHAVGATSVMPSVTFPAHTTMITGVNPNTHGVRTNSIFDPDGTLGGGWHFYYEDIKVPTLFDKARAAGLRTGAVTWPVTAGAPIDLNVPDMYPVPTQRDAKNLLALTRAGLAAPMLAELVPSSDALLHMKDDLRTKMAVRFAREKPDFLAVHLLELDEAQHTFGPRSPEALATLERIDGSLAAIFAELRAAGRWEETTIVLVSDHGFLPVTKELRPGVLLRTLGLSQVDPHGKLVWRAYAAPAGGTVAIYLHPLATAEDRRKVDDAVKLLLGNPTYGISRAYRGAELATTGGFSGAYVVLEAAPGTMIRGPEPGELVAPSTTFLGSHGYDPRRPEMRAAFVVRGPRIPAGRTLGVVRLLDVAPTIARILGVDLGKTEGKPIDLSAPKPVPTSPRVAEPSR